MATGGNVPELGGYDYEFTSKVPEDWECLVCHLTLKNPVQIVGCGHRLCNICMESLLRHPSPTCPADRQPLSREKIFPDAACHRRILDLTVKCSHSGCSWTGELRAMEKHQSECLFKVVKCPNSGCTKMLGKRDMKIHETFECSWRKVNCEYCQESVIMTQKQKHFDTCRKFPVLCTNKCGLRDIPREELEVHVRDECPATIVQCEYKNLGCEAVFPRSNEKSHSETQVKSHLNLALRGLEATKHQVQELVTVVTDQSQQIERLISKDKEQSQQIERLISKDKEQSEQINRLVPKVIEQSQQIKRHEQIIKINFSFKWIIPSFQAVCERAVTEKQSLLSEPFYLFKCGYKYLLKIELDDICRRPRNVWFQKLFPRHALSVYIKVVPGEFDELLSWPCREKLRVTLIDQNTNMNNRENISRVIDFENGEKPCSKRQGDDYHEYRLILNLKKDTLETRSYIKNDSILMMVNKE